MPKRRATYTGTLAKPIPYMERPGNSAAVASVLHFPNDRDAAEREFTDRLNRWAERYEQALMDKLAALFQHYKIESSAPDAMTSLALKLAMAHVPGFSMAKGPVGGPKTWSTFDTALLRMHIDHVQAGKVGRSRSAAAAIVARSGLWNAKLRAKPSGATLNRRAARADSRWVNMLNKAYRYQLEGENPPSVRSIDQFVREQLSAA